MSRRTQQIATMAVVGGLFAGCGSNGSSISEVERTRLVPIVEQVRRAAESRDPNTARRRLRELRHTVAAAEDRGDISPERSSKILSAAARVESKLALVPVVTAATTTTTSTTAPADDGPGKGNGKRGEGKGNKNENDD